MNKTFNVSEGSISFEDDKNTVIVKGKSDSYTYTFVYNLTSNASAVMFINEQTNESALSIINDMKKNFKPDSTTQMYFGGDNVATYKDNTITINKESN